MKLNLNELMPVSIGKLTVLGWAGDRALIESTDGNESRVHSLAEEELRQLYQDLERLLGERD